MSYNNLRDNLGTFENFFFLLFFTPDRLSFFGSFFIKHEGGDTHDSGTFNNEIMEYGIIKYALSW